MQVTNSEAREWRHDSDKTHTNKLEWWMILKIKAGVPKTLVKRKLRLHSLHFPQNSLTLTEPSGEFSDLHSIFRLRGFAIGNLCKILRWMLCRIALWTHMVKLRINSKVKIKVLCEAHNNNNNNITLFAPFARANALVKGIGEPNEVKKTFFWPRWESNPRPPV